jgi:hypothetical protein
MKYLDYDKLAQFDGQKFKQAKPFPWTNPQGLLTEAGFEYLMAHLPDISLFRKSFGVVRRHGQKGHDKYNLTYTADLDVDPCWHEFVAELEQQPYLDFLRKLYGTRNLKLDYSWYYTKSGGEVSPHVDASSKMGSHIFYLNTEDDWQAEWGGQTLMLDDGGKLGPKSAPAFSDFPEPIVGETLGNRSLLFRRLRHSWHGVRAIDCPEGHVRRVFIVVIKGVRPIKALKNFILRR